MQPVASDLMSAPPKLSLVRAEPAVPAIPERKPVAFDHHVLAYRAQTSGMAYVLYQLAERGLTLAELRAPNRHHPMVMLRGELAHMLKTKFAWTYPAIAQHFRKDHSSIHHCVAKFCCLTGADRGPLQVRREVTDEQMAEFKRLLQSGETASAAAKQCGLTISTAIRRAVAQGWYVIAERPGHKRRDLPYAEIERQYLAGVSLKDIADQFGVSTRSVSRFVDDFGWERRRRQAAEIAAQRGQG
jgi:AraC-like DNA-binding protein